MEDRKEENKGNMKAIGIGLALFFLAVGIGAVLLLIMRQKPELPEDIPERIPVAYFRAIRGPNKIILKVIREDCVEKGCGIPPNQGIQVSYELKEGDEVVKSGVVYVSAIAYSVVEITVDMTKEYKLVIPETEWYKKKEMTIIPRYESVITIKLENK